MSGVLPPLYEPWIEAVIGAPLPVEGRATCGDCVMLARGRVDDPDEPFDATTKCCTYTPYLPGFLAGRVLARAGEARARLEARIDGREGVTPLGIAPAEEARAGYEEMIAGDPGSFGRQRGLRCPHYMSAGGLCGIWQDRNAVCSTWFCRHERGQSGRRFWAVTRDLLVRLERGLSLHCVARLGLDAEACAALYLRGETPPWSRRDVHLAVWGGHLGAERDYFLACAELVAGLDAAGALAAAGEEAAHFAPALRSTFAELEDEALPARVAPAGDALYQIGRRPGHVRARPASTRYDFIDIPAAIADALPRLAGRPLEAALAELRAEGLAIDETMVRRLLDFQVLAPG